MCGKVPSQPSGLLRRNRFNALQGHLDGEAAHGTLVEVARRFGLEDGAVKMGFRRWRLRYGELIRAEVAQTVPRVANLEAELRHLLAALAG